MSTKKKRPESDSYRIGQHTLIAQARAKITGFSELINKFEKKLSVLCRSL